MHLLLYKIIKFVKQKKTNQIIFYLLSALSINYFLSLTQYSLRTLAQQNRFAYASSIALIVSLSMQLLERHTTDVSCMDGFSFRVGSSYESFFNDIYCCSTNYHII